jgi:uncharacterized OB-fold protein
MAMKSNKNKVPAIDGWFTMDFAEPHLIGSKCKACKSYFFPKESFFCRNPQCMGTEFEEVLLSSRGKLWSATLNCYQPPPPYVSQDPFVPYGIAAVELSKEKMVVLGQIAGSTDYKSLKAGMDMELMLEILYEDDDNAYIIWKWRPVPA